MIRFSLSPIKRFAFFLCVTLFSLIVGAVIVGIILHSDISTTRARLATIVQDLFVFILPAIITAVIITRQPADFLQIRPVSNRMILLLVIATILTMIPAMNYVIEWNANIQLPESMASVERWMKESEASSIKMVQTLIGGSGVGSLIVIVLIIAILAGFSEELYFRGALQRLFITSNINPAVAIWVTAFFFSAVHFQFYGFVPRLLLGAYFGYLAYWSRSLWPAVTAHVFNNLLAGYGMWLKGRGVAFSLEATDVHWSVVAISFVVTAILIIMTHQLAKKG